MKANGDAESVGGVVCCCSSAVVEVEVAEKGDKEAVDAIGCKEGNCSAGFIAPTMDAHLAHNKPYDHQNTTKKPNNLPSPTPPLPQRK